ncbi:DgyrCDS1096 [Dimorphilus gyrociliatus]|uniref:phosphoglucomutase (alpha-D-glucose-1,6-bisphosphate-dependent) n=1 Tax=Dimorphilus gyrociliatus TaxID=2664684 RepID=A0A7I8V6K4_9ANNE|nr:DgyrCDS1096 [Dimorphilus gyrociliatus]
MNSESIATKIYDGMKPGTSGLRKATKVFMQEHYVENFTQCTLEAALGAKRRGSSLVVSGDGRFFGKEAIKKIIQVCAANGVQQLYIGQNGILSTPAVSRAIRYFKADGGIILTASHNPGGLDADFGMKYNIGNGGPAPASVTDAIYDLTKAIKEYKICKHVNCDISQIGRQSFEVDGNCFHIDIIDSVHEYHMYMKEIFDFDLIRSAMKTDIKVLVNCLHGVVGPYAKRILVEDLGMDLNSAVNADPKEDFGGAHPDPNLTYASELMDEMKKGKFDIGAAFDGDGDRNMIIGKNGFFVSPCDSLAVIAANMSLIPYFQKTGIKGVARSMPTSGALDRVAERLKVPIYEVPTGWKFFGNLMDANKLSLCGEESFGTGSDHIREKDGLYDYENCDATKAREMMKNLEDLIINPSFIGKKFDGAKAYTVAKCDNFEYTDPIDGSLSTNQGLRIIFEDGSRLIFRLSGTGSSGATVRLYADSYVWDSSLFFDDAQIVLKPLVLLGLRIKISQNMEPINLTQHQVNFDESDIQSSISINAFSNLVSYEQELVHKDVGDLPIVTQEVVSHGDRSDKPKAEEHKPLKNLNKFHRTKMDEEQRVSSTVNQLPLDNQPTADLNLKVKKDFCHSKSNSQNLKIVKRREVSLPSGCALETLDEPFQDRPPSRANVHQAYMKNNLTSGSFSSNIQNENQLAPEKILYPTANRDMEGTTKPVLERILSQNSVQSHVTVKAKNVNVGVCTHNIFTSTKSTSPITVQEEKVNDPHKEILDKLIESEDLVKRFEQVIKTQHDEIQNLRSFVAKLQSDVGDSNAELYCKLERTRDTLVEKESIIEGLKNKLASVYVDYESAMQRSSVSEQEIKTLKSEMETVIEAKKWLQKQLDSATASRANLQSKLTSAQAKSIESASAIERMRAEKERANQALVTAQQQALREKQLLALHLETIEADIVQKEVELTQAKLERSVSLKDKFESVHSSLYIDMQQELENLRTSLKVSVEQLEQEQILKAEFAHRLALAHEMTVERDRRITRLNDTLVDNEKLQRDMQEQMKISNEIRKQSERQVSALEKALEKVQSDLIFVRDQMGGVFQGKDPPLLSHKIAIIKSSTSENKNKEILNLITDVVKDLKTAVELVEDNYDDVQLCISKILSKTVTLKITPEPVDLEPNKKNYSYIRTKAKVKSRQREMFEKERDAYEIRLKQLSDRVKELQIERSNLQANLDNAVAERTATASKLIMFQRNEHDLKQHITKLENRLQEEVKSIHTVESNLDLDIKHFSDDLDEKLKFVSTEKENLLTERKTLQMKLRELLHEREADIIHSQIVKKENQSLSAQLEELLGKRHADSEQRIHEMEEIYELRMKEWQADCTNRELSLKLKNEELEHKYNILNDKVRDFERLQELVAELQKNYREQAELRSEAERLLNEKEENFRPVCDNGCQTETKESCLVDLICKLQNFKQTVKMQETANGDSGIEDNVSSIVTLPDLSQAAKAACEENISLTALIKTYQQLIELIVNDSKQLSSKAINFEVSHENCLAKSEKLKLENKIRDLQHELECAATMHSTNLVMLKDLRQSELDARKECNENENTIRHMRAEIHRLSTDLEIYETRIPILEQQISDYESLLISKEKQILAQEEHIKCVEERFTTSQSSVNSSLRQNHADLDQYRNDLLQSREYNKQLKSRVAKLTEVLNALNMSKDTKANFNYSQVEDILEKYSENIKTPTNQSNSSLGVLQSCLNGLRSQITTLQSQVNGHLLKVQSSSQAWRDLKQEVAELQAICKE